MTVTSNDLVMNHARPAGRTITAEEVAKEMGKINRSKRSAERFLKEIGVSFSTTGRIRVRPL